jgi:hypothetical protein
MSCHLKTGKQSTYQYLGTAFQKNPAAFAFKPPKKTSTGGANPEGPVYTFALLNILASYLWPPLDDLH